MLALLFVLHLGVLALLVRASQERTRVEAPRRDDVLVVSLMPPEQAETGSAPAPRRPDAPAVRTPSAAPTEAPPAVAPEPVESPRLFGPDGSLMLPRDAPVAAAPEPGFHDAPHASLPALHNPVRYKATRYDPVWVKDHEDLGERIKRKSTFARSWDTDSGTRITCVWSPLYALAAFGCGWGRTPSEPAKPAPWLAVAGELRPDAPRAIDTDPFD